MAKPIMFRVFPRDHRFSLDFQCILRYAGPLGEKKWICDRGSWGVNSEQISEQSNIKLANSDGGGKITQRGPSQAQPSVGPGPMMGPMGLAGPHDL